ncbi:sugar phosphate isomerase/epimerase family protein [Krasilnikovia sp. M28-CT-15]|uniref:sugar phosphate isomerase/epimerase family protein n=1 Tax=Krasilnikovia sp. M28-CT-15 TaxID=3373540 RepID=UPI00387786D9
MRLRHRSGRIVHLGCDLDLPPARDLGTLIAQLDTYANAVRARLDVATLGIGLWLPPALAALLAGNGRARIRLRAVLDAHGLEVVTLNGVRYDDNPTTQRDQPDWSDPARLEYTLDLARILVDLLPDDTVRGAVSTLGLGRRDQWDADRERSCARILGRLSSGLAEIAWQTGRAVRVGFQPAAGHVLDSAGQTPAALANADKDRLGVCLDLADLACSWQDPADAITRLADAGLSVVQARIAAALEAADPDTAADALSAYLDEGHPYPVTTPDGTYFDDLPQALAAALPGPWRIRCPAPLHTAPAAALAATTEVWRTAVRQLMAGDTPGTEFLDVGAAGTWPPGRSTDVTVDAGQRHGWPTDPVTHADAIAAEYSYAHAELTGRGLSPPTTARAA